MTQLSRQQEELCEQSQWDFSDLRALYINCTLSEPKYCPTPLPRSQRSTNTEQALRFVTCERSSQFSTRNRRQLPGTPFSTCSPRS